MIEDPIKLRAITPPKYMNTACSVLEAQSVIKNSFKVMNKQLACYLPVLNKFLPTDKITNIQNIFKALDNPSFFTNVRQLANGFETSMNISLIKAGIYLLSLKAIDFELLSKTYNNYVLFDTEFEKNGIPQNSIQITRSLVTMNGFLPERLIVAWLDYNKSLCRSPDTLLPHEYLFLASNSFNRLKLFKENIKTSFELIQDNIGIYELDANLIYNPAIDLRLDNVIFSTGSVLFDFDKSLLDPPLPLPEPSPKKKVKNTESNDLRRLKELLQDPELIHQVRAAISKSKFIMSKTQYNNGRFSYIKYRKSKGIMGSLESSKLNLNSRTITRNHSDSAKTEAFYKNLYDTADFKSDPIKYLSRPLSASTTKGYGNYSRPQTAKRSVADAQSASTYPRKKRLSSAKNFKDPTK